MSATEVVLGVIFSILVVVNLVGNTLVCLVVSRNKSMRVPMNYLLVNLAAADMAFAVFVSPQFIFRPFFQHPEPQVGDFLCKVATGGSLSWVGTAASVFTLVLIAFERYYSILFPYSNKGRLTPQRAKLGIATSWLVAVISEIPAILVMKYNASQKICLEDWPNIGFARAYTLATLCFDFILPFTIVAAVYSKVIYHLWHGSNYRGTHISLLRRRKKVTKLLLFITALHGVCLLPDTVTYVLSYFGFQYGSIAYKVGTVLVCVNSTMNPFIYSLQSERFRRSLVELLQCNVAKRVWLASGFQRKRDVIVINDSHRQE